MSTSKAPHYTIPTSLNQDERIEDYLTQLRWFGARRDYKKLAEQNIKNHGTAKDYFEACLKTQLIDSRERQIKSRVLKAGFGIEKTIAGFDFKAKTNINEQQIRDLASCNFIKEKENIVFMGQSYVGKTHLAKGIARSAIDQNYNVRFIEFDRIVNELLFKKRDVDSQKRFFDSLVRPDLLVLDEIKYRQTTPEIQDFMYRLIKQRYEHCSTIFTSTKEFSKWKEVFGDYAAEAFNRIQDKEYLIFIFIKGEPYKRRHKN